MKNETLLNPVTSEIDYSSASKAKARCPLTHKVVSDSQCRECEVLCTGHPGEDYKELDKKSLKYGRKQS